MAYTDLSDEDKLRKAIDFVAVGQPLPLTLIEFLRSADLYELIVNPGTVEDLHVATSSINPTSN
jgi:hypothetical protein